MVRGKTRGFRFWSIQGPGWILLVYLTWAQGITAFSYDLGVRLGTQESPESITHVGAAFWYGFAFADLVTYIPLLLAALLGHLRGTNWGRLALAAAAGVSVYWPVVCLAAMVKARTAAGWHLASELPYWFVCGVVLAWGCWALAVALSDRE